MTDIPQMDGCVLVARGDDVIYRSHNGFADADAGRVCTPGTRFQLASVSKQFTATAILLLAEANRLNLTDELTTWIPEAGDWPAVTIHQMLTHTAGIGHWHDYPFGWSARVPAGEIVSALVSQPLRHAPGERFYYSSVAYALLAHIVERAGGMSYRDFLNHSILGPAGMRDSFVGNPTGQPDLALGYAKGKLVPSLELDVVNMGAGDLWSTVDDMWRWNKAVAGGLILSDRSREQAFARHAVMDPANPDEAYGYGWMVSTVDGRLLHEHTGDNTGYFSYNVWFPELDATAILLCNNEDQMSDLNEAIYACRALAVSG